MKARGSRWDALRDDVTNSKATQRGNRHLQNGRSSKGHQRVNVKIQMNERKSNAGDGKHRCQDDTKHGSTNTVKSSLPNPQPFIWRPSREETSGEKALLEIHLNIVKGLDSGKFSAGDALAQIEAFCSYFERCSPLIQRTNLGEYVSSIIQSIACVRFHIMSDCRIKLESYQIYNLIQLYQETLSRACIRISMAVNDQANTGDNYLTIINVPDHWSRNRSIARKDKKASLSSTITINRKDMEVCTKILSQECHEFLQAQFDECTTSNVQYLINILRCLSLLLRNCSQVLSPGFIANQIVYQTLVPVVDQANRKRLYSNSIENPFIRTIINSECVTIACELISWLLGLNQGIATSILSPLVVDLSDDGKEQVVENHIGKSMICALQILFLDSDCNCEDSPILASGEALLSSSQALAMLQNFHPQDTSLEHALDVSAIATKIVFMLKNTSHEIQDEETMFTDLKVLAFRLLSGFSQFCSTFVALTWKIFLLDRGHQEGLASESGILKRYICMAKSEAEFLVTWTASRNVIQALPLSKMKSSATRDINSRTGGLASEFSEALSSIICALEISLRSQITLSGKDDSPLYYSEPRRLEVIGAMVVTVTKSIPFKVFQGIAAHLVPFLHSFGNILVSLWEYSLHFPVEMLSKKVVDTLIDSFCGNKTPSGVVTPVPDPIVMWLEKDTEFIKIVISASTRDVRMYESHVCLEAIKVLGTIVRLIPKLGLDEAGYENLSYSSSIYNVIIKSLSENDTSLRFAGVELSCDFLEGRRTHIYQGGNLQVVDSCVTEMLLSKLLSGVHDPIARVRCKIVTALGLFTSGDWFSILKSERSSIPNTEHQDAFYSARIYFLKIAQLCCEAKLVLGIKGPVVSGETSSSVRSAACKSLATTLTAILSDDFGKLLTSELYSHASSFQKYVCHISVRVLEMALSDSSPEVRSMAHFAVGNLALESDSHTIGDWELSLQNIISLCTVSHAALTEDNERVVNNTIRSVGHLLSCLRRAPLPSLEEEKNRLSFIFCDTSLVLCQKIEVAITEALTEEKSISWRKRSFVKKHAWGSCSSLKALFFLPCLYRDDSAIGKISCALNVLISCISVSSSLHTKIAVGAAATLASIKVEFWTHNSQFRNQVSKCLKASVDILSSGAVNNDLRLQLLELVQVLIKISNWVDFNLIFDSDEALPRVLDSLLMIIAEQIPLTHEMRAAVFSQIAKALDNRQVSHFTLAQKFRSKCARELRYANASVDRLVHLSDATFDDEL